jgi:hypothetical protein
VVVVTDAIVCPGAGGCTVVVVVVPFESTVVTCCGCPDAAACFFAASIALSCFDSHPAIKKTARVTALASRTI